MVHLARRDLDRAIPIFERAVVTAREWSVADWGVPAVASLGYAYALTGRLPEGLALLEQVVEQDTTTGIKAGHSRTRHLFLLAGALFVAGRLDEALEHARQALDLACARGEQGFEAWIRRLLGLVASHRDPPDVGTAEGHDRQALELADKLGMRPLIAHCHLGLGALYHRIGDRAKADEYLTIATTMYREMDLGFWLAEADAVLRPPHVNSP
jgi:tetratricopeptide (TPR) repeat protein